MRAERGLGRRAEVAFGQAPGSRSGANGSGRDAGTSNRGGCEDQARARARARAVGEQGGRGPPSGASFPSRYDITALAGFLWGLSVEYAQ